MFLELRGEFVEYDPNDWSNAYRMKANVGLGTGDNEQKALTLRGILASQMQIAPTPIGYDEMVDGPPGPDGKPGPKVLKRKGLVKPEQIFNTLEQLAKLGGYENVSEFFTNPGDASMPTPPPAPPPYQVIVEQMKLAHDKEKAQFDAQNAQKMKLIDVEAQQRDKANQDQVQAANDERDAMRASDEASLNQRMKAMEIELERYKTDRDNETKIQIELMKTPGATLPPGYAIDPKTGLVMGPDRLAAMMAQLEAIYTQQAAPAQVVTHPDTQEVIGVEKGGVVRPVVRDDTGRIVGLGDAVAGDPAPSALPERATAPAPVLHRDVSQRPPTDEEKAATERATNQADAKGTLEALVAALQKMQPQPTVVNVPAPAPAPTVELPERKPLKVEFDFDSSGAIVGAHEVSKAKG
jgi:hypothetical protein